MENATTTARHGADDTQKFLKSTSLQVNHLLVTNYDELSVHLRDMLSGKVILHSDYFLVSYYQYYFNRHNGRGNKQIGSEIKCC